MNEKEYLRKLRLKRKAKVNQIQKYFETYYPSLKLKYSVGNVIKVRYKNKTIHSFTSLNVIGNRLENIHKLKHIYWGYLDEQMFHIMLKRFNINLDFGDKNYISLEIPKYFQIIKVIERQLVRNNILRISPRLKRK